MFGTNDWPAHLPTAVSPDLIYSPRRPRRAACAARMGRAGPDPLAHLATGRSDHQPCWPPGRGYTWYVSVPDPTSGRECIATAASPVPAGHYHAVGTSPLVCQRDLGASIDPMIVRDGGRRLHLLWNDCCGLPVSRLEQDLSSNGLLLLGQPHRLLSADQGWEGGVVEQPVTTPASRGGWRLFHAGNNWDRAAYATGIYPTLAGPCRDAKQGPFLSTQGSQHSHGGLDAFTNCCRSVELARLVSS